MSRKSPKFEALVVNAIRRLQAAQGSTANEIASYLSQEYDVSGPEIRRQIQVTIRRGLQYGILQKSKRGYTTCDRNVPDVDPMDEDCYECRVRRRRGGDRLLTRRARSKKRGGYRALGRNNARTGLTKMIGRQKVRVKKTVKAVHGRGDGAARKSRNCRGHARGHAGKPATRRPNKLAKARQKKQAPPEEPDNASTTSTNQGRSTSSKSPIRNASESNQDS